MKSHLYLRGRIWWMKYYVAHRPVQEATGRTKKSEAARVLAEKVGRAAAGDPIPPRMDRVLWEEGAADLRRHYEAHGTRDLKEYDRGVSHLTAFFRGRRIAMIEQAAVDDYIAARKEDGVVGATIRRELGTLSKLLRVACKNRKLARVPLIDKPREGEARAGFFEPDQYAAVRRALSADLQVALDIGYTYGWRKAEILSLERRHVDLDAGTLRLDPGTTKNKDPRVVHMTPALKALLAQQVERVRAVERKTGRIIPYLFPYLSGRRRLGQRRRDFRKAWATACLKAGLATPIEGVDGGRKAIKVQRVVHDLRRTAVRNMERAGVPRSVAMKMTGHRTENVYPRYAIVSDADLQAAAAKLAAVTIAVTVPRRSR